MSARKRGLGRGLEALLGAGTEASQAASTGDTGEALPEEDRAALKDLPVEFLQRGKYQQTTFNQIGTQTLTQVRIEAPSLSIAWTSTLPARTSLTFHIAGCLV